MTAPMFTLGAGLLHIRPRDGSPQMWSPAVDVDRHQVVLARLDRDPVVVSLHDLGLAGGLASRRCERWPVEGVAEADENPPDRLRIGDESDDGKASRTIQMPNQGD